jgi:hypothetical protein
MERVTRIRPVVLARGEARMPLLWQLSFDWHIVISALGKIHSSPLGEDSYPVTTRQEMQRDSESIAADAAHCLAAGPHGLGPFSVKDRQTTECSLKAHRGSTGVSVWFPLGLQRSALECLARRQSGWPTEVS